MVENEGEDNLYTVTRDRDGNRILVGDDQGNIEAYSLDLSNNGEIWEFVDHDPPSGDIAVYDGEIYWNKLEESVIFHASLANLDEVKSIFTEWSVTSFVIDEIGTLFYTSKEGKLCCYHLSNRSEHLIYDFPGEAKGEDSLIIFSLS